MWHVCKIQYGGMLETEADIYSFSINFTDQKTETKLVIKSTSKMKTQKQRCRAGSCAPAETASGEMHDGAALVSQTNVPHRFCS